MDKDKIIDFPKKNNDVTQLNAGMQHLALAGDHFIEMDSYLGIVLSHMVDSILCYLEAYIIPENIYGISMDGSTEHEDQ